MKGIKDKHFFFDGYSIKKEHLDNIGDLTFFTNGINELFFKGKGKIILIPYFSGKVKDDGGISAIIIGDNKHFTCHTFCYKNTVFIDYFGVENEEEKDNMKKKILDAFETNDFDLCDNNHNLEGRFGKHIIIRPKNMISFEDATKLVSIILKEIEMTPINDQIINYVNEENYDILQPIAESHISFHRINDDMIIDAFSCKYFDEKKLLELLGDSDDFVQIHRGIKYK